MPAAGREGRRRVVWPVPAASPLVSASLAKLLSADWLLLPIVSGAIKAALPVGEVVLLVATPAILPIL